MKLQGGGLHKRSTPTGNLKPPGEPPEAEPALDFQASRPQAGRVLKLHSRKRPFVEDMKLAAFSPDFVLLF